MESACKMFPPKQTPGEYRAEKVEGNEGKNKKVIPQIKTSWEKQKEARSLHRNINLFQFVFDF